MSPEGFKRCDLEFTPGGGKWLGCEVLSEEGSRQGLGLASSHSQWRERRRQTSPCARSFSGLPFLSRVPAGETEQSGRMSLRPDFSLS